MIGQHIKRHHSNHNHDHLNVMDRVQLKLLRIAVKLYTKLDLNQYFSLSGDIGNLDSDDNTDSGLYGSYELDLFLLGHPFFHIGNYLCLAYAIWLQITLREELYKLKSKEQILLVKEEERGLIGEYEWGMILLNKVMKGIGYDDIKFDEFVNIYC